MKVSTLAKVFSCLVIGAALFGRTPIMAQDHADRVVRLAELEIDPSRLEAYRAALREGIAASIRIEPGVLTLYAVSVKGQPNQIRLLEIYASPAAYQAHLQSAHFLTYKSTTAAMVRSLKLIETDPLMLGTK